MAYEIEDDIMPLFLINGFLEAGKTQFLDFTMQQDYFKADGKTLLIVCEEGDTEYDEKKLKKNRTAVVYVDSFDKLTPQYLNELEVVYRPERVLMEWNGMWNQDELKLPDDWTIYQQITIIDGSTFDLYVQNMKPLLGAMLRGSELVIMNRCDGIPDEKLTAYRRTIRAMSRDSEIVLEDKDGEIEQATLEEDLPYDLSANVIDMTNTVHSIEKESLQDIGQLMDQMGADFIILRHSMAGAPRLLASCVEASVINAGDGFNENPGQSLLDLLTIREQKGGFEGLKVAIIGDLLHSRVSKSNIWGLTKLGAEVCVSGPPTLMLPAIENFGVEVYYDAREAVNNADVILTTRMRMEKQDKKSLPSLDEYKRLFRIDENLLRYAKKDAIVMHPGPIQRGIEISSGVIDSKQCIINDQIGNSVAVRMAMFYILSQVGGAFR